MPAAPGERIRIYRGDGNHMIDIRFKDGAVMRIHETVPRNRWPPVG
jgi:hypothetical protein